MRQKAREKSNKTYPAIKWTEDIKPLKWIVEREDAIPLNQDDMMGLVQEMDDREQRRMASILLFPFALRAPKSWPKQLFLKSIRSALHEANADLSCKRRIILAILQQLHTHMGQDAEEQLGSIQQDIESFVTRYGPWHVYWMSYLHPDRDEAPDRWDAVRHAIREQITHAQMLQMQLSESARETASTASQPLDIAEPATKLMTRKLNRLHNKLQKELTLRQKLELEVAQLRKQIRYLDRKRKILEYQLSSEAERAEQAELEVKRLKNKLDAIHQEHFEEKLTWKSQKIDLVLEIDEHKKEIGNLNIQLKERAEETQQLRDQARATKKSLRDRGYLLNKLIDVSYKDLSQMGQRAAALSKDTHARQQLRRNIRELLEQIEVLESYREDEEPAPSGDDLTPEATTSSAATTNTNTRGTSGDAPSSVATASVASADAPTTETVSSTAPPLPDPMVPAVPPASAAAGLESAVISHSSTPKASGVTTSQSAQAAMKTDHSGSTSEPDRRAGHSVQPSSRVTSAPPAGSNSSPVSDPAAQDGSTYSLTSTGTFYRRDHGGFISLDNGESFNIPESVVIEHELQHEAEVLCRPIGRQHGTIMYSIELLFQGDDYYSPIHQYDGYVQRGEQGRFYCVDLNNPEHRYPIHFRDVEIQKPEDGMPCTFNVAEDGEYARLSRLYRDYIAPSSDNEDDTTSSSRKQVNRSNKSKGDPTPKPDPYLIGCTITILGGQRKWFEHIVSETGAELIHDGGDNPERIAPSMRRSNALFMMITATSHRATWIGVEIAKENGIPHFVIQGSKSNLRMLLWENQDVIRGTQERA